MNPTPQELEIFRAAFYRNTGDDTDDPVEIALKAVFAHRAEVQVAIDPKWLALAAAAQATEAAAELMRFAREGATLDGTFENDPIMRLLDAAKMAIEALPEGEESMSFSSIYNDLKHEVEFWV